MFNQISGAGGVYASPNYAPVCTNTGVMRWNGAHGQVEVMGAGDAWHVMTNVVTVVELDSYTKNIVNWAAVKKAEEEQLAALCEQHPGLQDCKDRFDVMLALVKQQRAKNAPD